MKKTIMNLAVVLQLLTFFSTVATAATLQSTVIDVLKNHPRLLAAKAGQQVDQYALSIARSGFLPKILLKVGRGTEVSGNSVVRTAVSTRAVQYNRQEHSINFNQMIFDGFRTQSEVNEQRFSVKSAHFSVHAAEQDLIQQTTEAYLNVLRARELVILARHNIKLHQQTLKNIQLRFQGGAGTRGEIQLAESRLALATVGLGAAMGRLNQGNAVYFAIVTHPVPLIMARPPSVRTYLPKTNAEAVKMALWYNPDVNGAKAKMASADAAVHSAQANMLPRVDLEVNATDSQNLDGVLGRNFDLSAMIVMNYALYKGGQDLASLNKARTRRVQNLHLVNTARRDVLQRVTRTWAEWQENLNVYKFYRAYVIKQRAVVKDYQQQFSLGKRALFNVLDAENELFRARVGLAEAYYNAKINTYKLLARIGKLTPKVI
jgi:outer membrane protein, adhesin transport system